MQEVGLSSNQPCGLRPPFLIPPSNVEEIFQALVQTCGFLPMVDPVDPFAGPQGAGSSRPAPGAPEAYAGATERPGASRLPANRPATSERSIHILQGGGREEPLVCLWFYLKRSSQRDKAGLSPSPKMPTEMKYDSHLEKHTADVSQNVGSPRKDWFPCGATRQINGRGSLY